MWILIQTKGLPRFAWHHLAATASAMFALSDSAEWVCCRYRKRQVLGEPILELYHTSACVGLGRADVTSASSSC